MSSPSFTLENNGATYPLKRGYTILNNLLFNNIISAAKCGGKAMCGRCRVLIIEGQSYCNKPNAEEKAHLSERQLNEGWRLACQAHCLKSLRFYLPTVDEIEKTVDSNN